MKSLEIETRNHLHARFVRFAGLSGWFAIVLGVLSLAGRSMDIGLLTWALPGVISMNPMMAVCFVIAGRSLLLQLRPDNQGGGRVRFARLLGWIVAVIGLLLLGRYVFGWSFKPDQLQLAGESGENFAGTPNRMGELMIALPKLSRLTRAKMNLETVDLSEIAESLVAEYRAADPARKLGTVIEPQIRVLADPALLRVLLDNLLGNAWKFTGKNPAARIEVGSTPDGLGEIICHVRDNGVGFDFRYAHKLFGAFQRLHSQAEFPGTGIGLATVQRIISRHGGEVRVEGEINHGATFSFVLGTPSSDEKQDHIAG